MVKALIIVDMQNDFITGVLGNAECEAVVPEIEKILKENTYDEILVTLDTHNEDYLNTQEGKKLPVEHCIKGTEGWNLNERLKKAIPQKYKIFEKPVFGSTELAQYVAGKYDEIDMVGVCTGICVVSNALCIKASDPDVEINVFEKATACVTPESKIHALETMKMCQINVL